MEKNNNNGDLAMGVEKQKSGVFINKRVYFSQVSNTALRDKNLSFKAKGLYALIQSFVTLENFELHKSYLKKYCSEKEKAFESTWKELKDKGYLIQYRLQDTKTKRFFYQYELLDEPNLEKAEKVHNAQNRKNKTEKSHTPKKEGMEKSEENSQKSHTPKKDPMDNGPYGKGGVYNNTDFNNTDFNNTKDTTTSEKKENSSSSLEINLNINKATKQNIQKMFLTKENIELLEKYVSINKYKDINGFSFYIAKEIKKGNITDKDLIKKSNNQSLKLENFKNKDYDYDALERELLGWD